MEHTKIKLDKILMSIVIIGAVNWGFVGFGYNIVTIFSDLINNLFKTNYSYDKIIYFFIAFAAIRVGIKRDTWLPFLGKSILPDSLIPLKKNLNTNRVIKIETRPDSKIVYWAALPKGTSPDVLTAYGDYSNSGVVMSDKNGVAELPIQEGSNYVVPSGNTIPRHVHYRIIGLPYGFMSKVKTINY